MSFKWDGNGEILAELGGTDEDAMPPEREAAYAWVCKKAHGEDMYITNASATAAPPAALKEVDVEVELGWPRWVGRRVSNVKRKLSVTTSTCFKARC